MYRASERPTILPIAVFLLSTGIIVGFTIGWQFFAGSIVEELFEFDTNTTYGTYRYVLPITITNDMSEEALTVWAINCENYEQIIDWSDVCVVNESFEDVQYDVKKPWIVVKDTINVGQTRQYYLLWNNPAENSKEIYISFGESSIPLEVISGYDGVAVEPDTKYKDVYWSYKTVSINMTFVKDTTVVLWAYSNSAPNYVLIKTIEGDVLFENRFTHLLNCPWRDYYKNPQLIVFRIPYTTSGITIYADRLLLFYENSRIIAPPVNVSVELGNVVESDFVLEFDNAFVDIKENDTATINGRIYSTNYCKGVVGIFQPKWGVLGDMLSINNYSGNINPTNSLDFTLSIKNTTGNVGEYYLPFLAYDGTRCRVQIVNLNIWTPTEPVYIYENIYVYENIYIREEIPDDVRLAWEWLENRLNEFIEFCNSCPNVKKVKWEIHYEWRDVNGLKRHFKYNLEWKDGKIHFKEREK